MIGVVRDLKEYDNFKITVTEAPTLELTNPNIDIELMLEDQGEIKINPDTFTYSEDDEEV